MRITATLLEPITHGRADPDNVRSVVDAFNQYASHPTIALNQPHRAAQYFAQIGHESGGFRYDEEVWGPTPAQVRYDTRTDLGNTPEVDGDGHLYRGRTGIQITGRSNYIQFRDWLRSIGLNPPDFEAEPDRVNEDPWEGLAPIWYWTTRKLNRYADSNDIEMVTRRINGGLNGYSDRLTNYSKIALGLNGYGHDKAGIQSFQTYAKARGWYGGEIDGIDGPQTRAALHKALVKMGSVPTPQTKPSPVTEPIPVAPAGAQKTGAGRVAAIVGLLGTPFAAFANMDTTGKLIVVGVASIAVIVLLTRGELVARRVKKIVKEFS